MTIGAGRVCDGLYLFTIPKTTTKPLVAATTTYELWHRRLGHPSRDRLRLLTSHIPDISVPISEYCGICPLAKQTRIPFPLSTKRSLEPFNLIHCDIWGPYRVASLTRARYFLSIVDDYTRCTWVFLMQTKAETRSLLCNFYAFVEVQFH